MCHRVLEIEGCKKSYFVRIFMENTNLGLLTKFDPSLKIQHNKKIKLRGEREKVDSHFSLWHTNIRSPSHVWSNSK